MKNNSYMPYYKALHKNLLWNPPKDSQFESVKEQREKQLLDFLPSGSGIDNGVKLESFTKDKIVLSFGFHHMNDGGYYDGWTDHKLIIKPSFDGIDIRITGRDRNMVKEYLYDMFYYVLTSEFIYKDLTI